MTVQQELIAGIVSDAKVEFEHALWLLHTHLALDRWKSRTSGTVDLHHPGIDGSGIFEWQSIDDVCVGLGDGGRYEEGIGDRKESCGGSCLCETHGCRLMGEVPSRSNVVLVDLDGIDVLKTGFDEDCCWWRDVQRMRRCL